MAEILDRRIIRSEYRVADLESQAAFRDRWLSEHPQVARRVEHVHRELQRLHDPIRAEALDRADAIKRGDAAEATQAREHDSVAKVRARLDRLEQARGIEPPGLSL